jgi:hypothetical protein
METKIDNMETETQTTTTIVEPFSLNEFNSLIEKRESQFDSVDKDVVDHFVDLLTKGVKLGKTKFDLKFEEEKSRFDGYEEKVRTNRLNRIEQKVTKSPVLSQILNGWKLSSGISSTVMTEVKNAKEYQSSAFVHEMSLSSATKKRTYSDSPSSEEDEEDEDQPKKKKKAPKPKITLSIQLSKKEKKVIKTKEEMLYEIYKLSAFLNGHFSSNE